LGTTLSMNRIGCLICWNLFSKTEGVCCRVQTNLAPSVFAVPLLTWSVVWMRLHVHFCMLRIFLHIAPLRENNVFCAFWLTALQAKFEVLIFRGFRPFVISIDSTT
jgi:hypothetical protein